MLYVVIPSECIVNFDSEEFVATNLLDGSVIEMDAEDGKDFGTV